LKTRACNSHGIDLVRRDDGRLELLVVQHGGREAVELLEDGSDIRAIQELLVHQDVTTTMNYTHVLNRGPTGVRSPADRLFEFEGE
jgi:integrase